jgi:hypothetical protein
MIMQKMQSLGISCLLVIGTLSASSAFAASYTVGGSANGTSHVTGPTKATVVGNSLSCSAANFTVQTTGGVAKVTAATFGTTAACQAITANNLPWTISPPTSAGGPNNVKINGASVTIPALGTTCTGNITGTLTTAGAFSFNGALGFCTVQSTSPLSSSPVLKAVYP